MRVDRPTQERESAFYGSSWGFPGDYGHLRNLTTNQKAAGSSPAERTTNYLETRHFRLLESTLVSFRTIHLTTYLFPEGFAGRYRALCSGGGRDCLDRLSDGVRNPP